MGEDRVSEFANKTWKPTGEQAAVPKVTADKSWVINPERAKAGEEAITGLINNDPERIQELTAQGKIIVPALPTDQPPIVEQTFKAPDATRFKVQKATATRVLEAAGLTSGKKA